MTTRAERAAQSAARLRARQEVLTRRIARQAAIQRAEETKARDKRRYLVGKLVEDAGLFAWTDAQLDAIFQGLSRFAPLPHAHLLLAQLLIRAPLAQWMQEATAVEAEVQTLIREQVTLVVVGEDGQPLRAENSRVH